MKNGLRYTELDMGWLGNQEVALVFEDDQLTHVYWDSVDVIGHLRDVRIKQIQEEMYEDPLNGSRHVDALIKLWKESK